MVFLSLSLLLSNLLVIPYALARRWSSVLRVARYVIWGCGGMSVLLLVHGGLLLSSVRGGAPKELAGQLSEAIVMVVLEAAPVLLALSLALPSRWFARRQLRRAFDAQGPAPTPAPAPPADAHCNRHPRLAAAFTCTRCGDYACRYCRKRELEYCPSCREIADEQGIVL